MFFNKITPMFPVVHQPTFASNASTPLLLNACALGSLFLGTEDSLAKGEALWHFAHSLISASWSSMINDRGEHDACPGTQLVLSALLGQLYATFSSVSIEID